MCLFFDLNQIGIVRKCNSKAVTHPFYWSVITYNKRPGNLTDIRMYSIGDKL